MIKYYYKLLSAGYILKTLYIDIYFLINFTIDLIALYFAALFVKIKVSNINMILSAALGALSSCLIIFLEGSILYILFSIISILLMIVLCAFSVTVKRKVIFGFSFIIFLSVFGGIVSFLWETLSDVFSKYSIKNDDVNRKMLFLSLIILLSIGVCKMMIAVLKSGKIETKVMLRIKFLGKECSTEALIDTGNLAIDPLRMKPILLIKKKLAQLFIPTNVIELIDVDLLEKDIKKKIILVPLSKNGSTHMYVGIVPDCVTVYHKDREEAIDVTVVIDKEGGDFGGFMALMPFSAVDNVFD